MVSISKSAKLAKSKCIYRIRTSIFEVQGEGGPAVPISISPEEWILIVMTVTVSLKRVCHQKEVIGNLTCQPKTFHRQ